MFAVPVAARVVAVALLRGWVPLLPVAADLRDEFGVAAPRAIRRKISLRGVFLLALEQGVREGAEDGFGVLPGATSISAENTTPYPGR